MVNNITVRIFSCKKCGFVRYTPFIRCPLCGKMRESNPKRPKPTKKKTMGR